MQKSLPGRREFTAQAVLLALAGVTVTVSGCGGGGGHSPSGPSNSGTTSGNVVGNVSNNHGHSAEIVAAQLAAGGAVSLNIRGVATHDHGVTLSAAQVAQIAGGGTVSVQSSTGDADGHLHTVTFARANDPGNPGGYY